MSSKQVSRRAFRKWNPSQYLKFEGPRLRPAIDLLRQVPLDSSAEMLSAAKKYHEKAFESESSKVTLEYQQKDFEAFATKTKCVNPPDLIFSNAALHWVDYTVRAKVLTDLMSQLIPGGVLAVQMPDSRLQASHLMMQQAIRELSIDNSVVESIRWVTNDVDPAVYYDLLAPISSYVNIWTSTYTHVLQGENPVADFTASTGLGPYVEALGGKETAEGIAFIRRYRQLVENCYTKQSDCSTLFDMKRIFIIAQKS